MKAILRHVPIRASLPSLVLLLAFSISAVRAQDYAPPTAAANSNALATMSEDIQALRRLVNQLRLDVATLQQENESLRKQLITPTDLNAAVQNAVAKNRDEMSKAFNQAITQTVTQANADLRKEIVATVTKQIEALARETNDQLQILAKAIGKAPPVNSRVAAAPPDQAPPSYDKVEIYIVKPGENLSLIAARYHVSVSDIVKANPSIDPNKIRDGQSIGIPIKSGAN